MIELRTIRIDVHGRFEFRIKSPNEPWSITQSKGEAIGILEGLGVKDAAHLIEHALIWGEVDIADPS
jgi:hypothetical protein